MIKRRNVMVIVFLWMITLGLYGLVWLYSTSNELIRSNKQNDNPLGWTLLAMLPPLNVFVMWWHAQAVARMSDDGRGYGINPTFLLILWFPWLPVVPTIGAIITQIHLNERATAPA